MAGWGFSLESLKSKVQEAGEKVKAKVNEIDTTKVKETLARTRDSATETLTQARMFSESQLQETTTQARQLADRQAKQLSKVNAKSLLNSHANFGVPIEALAYRDENGVPCDDVSVPKPLNMMITYLESSPPVGAGAGAVSALFAVSASSAAQGVPALVKAMDTHIAEVDLSLQTEPAVVAALLRQWLVDLPEPLLTHGLYDAFTKAYRSEGQKEAMIEVAGQLPYTNWLSAKRLLEFLAALHQKDPEGLHTLAVSFGPALLRPRKGLGGGLAGGALRGLLEDLPLICDVAQVIISHAPDMFKSYPEIEAAKVWEGVGDGQEGNTAAQATPAAPAAPAASTATPQD
eukprot:Tamp_14806.p1 GENE.Tamp_14806~~Tamp_14806.p1  ORF type:complete len:353 (-),score=92.44 Tamp_14806:540-1577(-)